MNILSTEGIRRECEFTNYTLLNTLCAKKNIQNTERVSMNAQSIYLIVNASYIFLLMYTNT